MYYVEALIPYIRLSGEIGAEWEDIYNVPQLETDQAELEKAREMCHECRRFYTWVRIVKTWPSGQHEIVHTCPFTQPHTREWCGYSECREF